MTTPQQVEANRRNARKSRGPKTPEGRAVSSRNSIKHGLLSKQLLLPGESAHEFEELGRQLKEDLKPIGAFETRLVEDMAADFWRLSRIRRIEAGIFAWQGYQIESERALERAQQYERKEFKMVTLEGMPPVDVEDREHYDEAMAAAEKARVLQEQELPTLGFAFLRDASNANGFSKLSRCEATITRSIYRVLHELQRLQAARKGAEVAAPVAVDVNVDVGPSSPLDGG